MYHKLLKNKEKIFAIAPMMDWTDRHCRYFHRQMTRHALLYTEMVVADAAIHGDRDYLLKNDVGGPVALQLGGSDPAKLAEAARIGEGYGYDEINLNVGCPSDRVQSGTFGACLMLEPQLVGRCVAAMKQAVAIPITVKCRLGVDSQEPGEALNTLARDVFAAGCDGLWVHARKAWLDGLSPKQNRDVPPLDYGMVRQLKLANMNKFIGLNGGLENLSHAMAEMTREPGQLDGVMLGRAAYQRPATLRDVDRQFYGSKACVISFDALIDNMANYADWHIANGGYLGHVTRHMIGLFQGLPGARRWRQMLSIEVQREGANGELIRQAYRQVRGAVAMDAA